MCVQRRRPGIDPWVGRSPGEGNGDPLQFLPGKFYRQRSLVGYSPWGCKELDRIEQLTLAFILKEKLKHDHLFFICLMLKLKRVDINCMEEYVVVFIGMREQQNQFQAYILQIYLAHTHYVSCMAKMSYHYLQQQKIVNILNVL